MKVRTIRHVTAALAVLACLAGYAMTNSKAQAQNTFKNPLAGFTEEALLAALQVACDEAWNTSSASHSCVLRYEGVVAKIDWNTPDWRICSLTGVYCERSRGVYIHNPREFTLEETRGLINCSGILSLSAC